MAKKKIEPIESLGNTDKLTVQKSKPLFALWQSELTLAEFKILDTYLGRINSHDDEHRTVKFEKGELELTDDILFQSAICFAKEYLKEVLANG